LHPRHVAKKKKKNAKKKNATPEVSK